MPNNYFRFKQFTVHQGGAAMKVGTDGVLLGAWADANNAIRLLDVGTGTGLLALMAAQRNPQAVIDAVEIDEEACCQARENVQNSIWANRIHVLHSSFQDFSASNTQLYDAIISNPPYFDNSLLSPVVQRNLARHTACLSYVDLLTGAKKLLTDTGRLSLIIPADKFTLLMEQADTNGFYCSRKWLVAPNPYKSAIRVLLEFTLQQPVAVDEYTLCIDNGSRHEYTPEYQALTKDFYLKF